MYGCHPLDFRYPKSEWKCGCPGMNTLIVPPGDVYNILIKVKHGMRINPRLELPDDTVISGHTFPLWK